MKAGYVAAGACVLIWGANYSIAKRALQEIDPLAIAFTRAAAGALFFGLLLLACHGGVRATCVTCPAEIAPAPSAPERLDLTSVPISMDFSKSSLARGFGSCPSASE